MKKFLKTITKTAAIIITIGMLIISSSADFSDNSHMDFETVCNLDGLIEEIDEYNLQLIKVQNEYNEGYISYNEFEIQKDIIESSIQKIKNKILNGEGDDISSDTLKNVLQNADYGNSLTTRSTPDLSHLASQLNQMYDAYGKQSTYYDGKKNYQIYEIYVTHNPNKSSGLSNMGYSNSKYLYNSGFAAGSTEAQNWINEILDIYIGKITSSALELIPGMRFVPYELLTSSKPSKTEISAPNNSTLAVLNTVTSVKFTYVLDENTDTWKYCSSTNKVSVAASYILLVSYRGVAKNCSTDLPTKVLYGGYTNSIQNAVNIFKGNYSAGNYCLNLVKINSIYKGNLQNSVPSPNNPMGL